MEKRKIIQQLIKEKLSEMFDPVMKEKNFNRKSNSLVYLKKTNVLTHKIYFHFQCSPHFLPEVDAYLNPTYRLYIPDVSHKALELLGDNKMALGLDPEIVLSQPYYFFIEDHDTIPYLSLTLNKDNTQDLNQLKEIITRWVLPQVNKINNLQDFVKIYEDNFPFSISKKDYIFFIAAYIILGQKERARNLLEKEFSKQGAKSLYKPLYENFLKSYP